MSKINRWGPYFLLPIAIGLMICLGVYASQTPLTPVCQLSIISPQDKNPVDPHKNLTINYKISCSQKRWIKTEIYLVPFFNPLVAFSPSEPEAQWVYQTQNLKEYSITYPASCLSSLTNNDSQLYYIYVELYEYKHNTKPPDSLVTQPVFISEISTKQQMAPIWKFKTILPGEIFNHLINLRNITKQNITNAKSVFKLPDNTLGGFIELNGKWVLFKGNTIIDEIGGKKINYEEDYNYIDLLPNGDFAGKIGIINSNAMNFVGNTLIDNEDIDLEKTIDFWINIESYRLYGRLADDFLNSQLAGTFKSPPTTNPSNQSDYKNYENSEVITVNGTKIQIDRLSPSYHYDAGVVLGEGIRLEDNRRVIVAGHLIIDEILGKKMTLWGVSGVDNKHISYIRGTIEGDNKKLIKFQARQVHILSDNSLAGIIEIDGQGEFLFKDKTLINQLAGKRIIRVWSIYPLQDNTISGALDFADGYYEFLWNAADSKLILF